MSQVCTNISHTQKSFFSQMVSKAGIAILSAKLEILRIEIFLRKKLILTFNIVCVKVAIASLKIE